MIEKQKNRSSGDNMLTQKSQTYKFQCVSLSKHIEAEARSDLRRVLRVGFTVSYAIMSLMYGKEKDDNEIGNCYSSV